MARLKNTNLSAFYAMSVHKNHFKKQKYEIESIYETLKIPKI